MPIQIQHNLQYSEMQRIRVNDRIGFGLFCYGCGLGGRLFLLACQSISGQPVSLLWVCLMLSRPHSHIGNKDKDNILKSFFSSFDGFYITLDIKLLSV